MISSGLNEKDYLRLDVAMKNAISMHVVNRLEHLIHVVFYSLLWQVVTPAFDRLIHVHVHELEDQGQSTRRLITVNRRNRTS